jgi:hypothetical protein
LLVAVESYGGATSDIREMKFADGVGNKDSGLIVESYNNSVIESHGGV